MTNWAGPKTWAQKFQGSNIQATEVLWAKMQSLHIFEFLCCAGFDNADCHAGQGRHLAIGNCHGCGYAPSISRTSNVVLFGVFRGEEVPMPRRVDLSKKSSSRARTLDLVAELNTIDIPKALEVLYLQSGIPNRTPTGPTTPPTAAIVRVLTLEEIWPDVQPENI